MKSFAERHPVLIFLFILLLFGLVGSVDFEEDVRLQYQNRCPGTIQIEGNLVICNYGHVPVTLGVIK